MTLEDLFKKYGAASEQMDEKIYLNFTRADKLDTLQRIAEADKWTEQKINKLLLYAEALKEYRQTLFDRAQEFYTADYKYLLKISRSVETWKDNKKFYTVTVQKIYNLPNTRPETVLTETYSGTERHKAFKRFEELQKQYPNIETEKDTDKKYWER